VYSVAELRVYQLIVFLCEEDRLLIDVNVLVVVVVQDDEAVDY
jgi:hypothetical protein